MRKNNSLWCLWGFATTSFLGTILHFLYDWANQSPFIAPISAVNESTWEHMKLFFFPAFAFAIVQSFFFRERADFWRIKLKGILLGLILIPIIFYTYNGAIGKSPDWINISIFFISAAISYIYELKHFGSEEKPCKRPKFALIILCIIGLLFVLFTFKTPMLNIFKDPTTNTYGI